MFSFKKNIKHKSLVVHCIVFIMAILGCFSTISLFSFEIANLIYALALLGFIISFLSADKSDVTKNIVTVVALVTLIVAVGSIFLARPTAISNLVMCLVWILVFLSFALKNIRDYFLMMYLASITIIASIAIEFNSEDVELFCIGLAIFCWIAFLRLEFVKRKKDISQQFVLIDKKELNAKNQIITIIMILTFVLFTSIPVFRVFPQAQMVVPSIINLLPKTYNWDLIDIPRFSPFRMKSRSKDKYTEEDVKKGKAPNLKLGKKKGKDKLVDYQKDDMMIKFWHGLEEDETESEAVGKKTSEEGSEVQEIGSESPDLTKESSESKEAELDELLEQQFENLKENNQMNPNELGKFEDQLRDFQQTLSVKNQGKKTKERLEQIIEEVIEELKTQQDMSQERLDDLKRKLEEIKEQNNDIKETGSNMQRDQELQEESDDIVMQSVSSVEEQSKDTKEQLKGLEAELKSLEKKLKGFEVQKEEARKQASIAKAIQKEPEASHGSEKTKTEDSIQQSQESKEEEADSADGESSSSTLEQSLASASSQTMTLSEQLNSLSQSIESYQNQLSLTSASRDGLSSAQGGMETQGESLDNSLASSISAITQQNTALNAELEGLDNQLDGMQDALNETGSMQEGLGDNEEELEQEEDSLSELANQTRDLMEEQDQDLSEALDSLQEELTSVKEELESKEVLSVDENSLKQKIDKTLSAINKQKSTLMKQFDDLKEELKSMDEQLKFEDQKAKELDDSQEDFKRQQQSLYESSEEGKRKLEENKKGASKQLKGLEDFIKDKRKNLNPDRKLDELNEEEPQQKPLSAWWPWLLLLILLMIGTFITRKAMLVYLEHKKLRKFYESNPKMFIICLYRFLLKMMVYYHFKRPVWMSASEYQVVLSEKLTRMNEELQKITGLFVLAKYSLAKMTKPDSDSFLSSYMGIIAELKENQGTILRNFLALINGINLRIVESKTK